MRVLTSKGIKVLKYECCCFRDRSAAKESNRDVRFAGDQWYVQELGDRGYVKRKPKITPAHFYVVMLRRFTIDRHTTCNGHVTAQ